MLNHIHQSQSGKIERSFRTIKDNFQNCTDWNSFKDLNDINEQYTKYINDKYNNVLHSSIDDTPNKRFMKEYDTFKFLPKEQIDIIFLHTVTRKVLNDATIKINTITFEVPQKYIKQNIEVKYPPDNTNVAYIYDANGKLKEEIHPVDKKANSKVKRATLSFENMRGDASNV